MNKSQSDIFKIVLIVAIIILAGFFLNKMMQNRQLAQVGDVNRTVTSLTATTNLSSPVAGTGKYNCEIWTNYSDGTAESTGGTMIDAVMVGGGGERRCCPGTIAPAGFNYYKTCTLLSSIPHGSPPTSSTLLATVGATTAILNGFLDAPIGNVNTTFFTTATTSTGPFTVIPGSLVVQPAPLPPNPTSTVIAAESPISFTVPITSNHTYYYQFNVSSTDSVTHTTQTATGTTLSFTTPPPTPTCPSNATTQAATNISRTTATLNGCFTALAGSATKTQFRYNPLNVATTVTPLTLQSGTTGTVALPIANLTPNTTYKFRMTTTSAAGSATGVVLAFTTAP